MNYVLELIKPTPTPALAPHANIAGSATHENNVMIHNSPFEASVPLGLSCVE